MHPISNTMTKSESTRDYIIEKTAPLFNRKGYSGTSLSDITKSTGLSKGGIYGNFSNKDEVAMAAFIYNVNKISAVFEKETAAQATYKQKLLVYPRLYAQAFEKIFNSGGCPILNTAIEADDTHPALRHQAGKAIRTWKEKLVHFIEQGIEAGEFKAKGIDPERTALAIISTIEGAVMIAKVSAQPDCLPSVMLVVTEFINRLE